MLNFISMGNNSEEINLLVEQAKMFLGSKVKQLSNNNSINSEIRHKIIDLEKRIKDLEDYTNVIEELYSTHPNVIINFRKRASDISEEIAKV